MYIKIDNNFVISNDFKIEKLQYKTREDVYKRPDIWKTAIETIIEKLNTFFKSGRITTISATDVFSDKGLISLVLSSQAEVTIFLEKEITRNVKLDSAINMWWKCVHKEYPGYSTPYTPLAFSIILKWFNRFVFSNILYAYGKISQTKPILPADVSISSAIEVFKEISSKSDYWNVLGPSEFDKFLPDSVWKKLLSIFNLLQDYDFSQIDKSILSEIIQSTVLISIKKAAGLFSTPQNVAELLVRLAMWKKDSEVIDPFCGTGTIVKNILEVKREYNIDGKTIVHKTWACDKFAFPVQIATLVVASSAITNEAIQIFTHDTLKLFIDEPINFINPKDGSQITKKIPKFDSIISNLPFVQFADIKELNPEIYTKIQEFYKAHNIKRKDQLGGRSDLYCFLPFILLQFLEDDGILGIIISNSWLSTKAGNKFWKLLHSVYDIIYVVTSANGKWFNNTDVVANILVLQKKQNIPKRETAFVTLDVDINKTKNIKNICDQIFTDNYGSNEVSIRDYSEEKIQKIQNLGFGLNICFGDCDWLFDNFDKFEPISTYAKISRGERRGWNPLFYPSEKDAFSIESEYIKKVCRTAKGEKFYTIKPASYAFCCDKSLEELKEKKQKGAYKWIQKFENEINKKGQPLKKILARKDLKWYEMSSASLAKFVLSNNPEDRKSTRLNSSH